MDDQDLTPLQVAAQKGHLDVVKCLIENGADVHLWNNDFTLDGKLVQKKTLRFLKQL